MSEASASLDFIRQTVADDLRAGRVDAVVTRFPPEPNGYLHIGHAKSICLNFGLAEQFGGRCHLRFDDTNPAKEEQAYIDAIKRDVRWLGFDWAEHEHHASDYFDQLYEWARLLIEHGRAYVDDQSAKQVRHGRGTLTRPGVESPFRDRPPAESLDLFARMKAGEFPDGSRVVRARIDMTSPNLNLRDPVMYRILHAAHPRTGERWCVYPMYDWAHGQSDWIEGITHSICTLEFADHRPLYDWFIEQLIEIGVAPAAPHVHAGLQDAKTAKAPTATAARPHQYEFARLNLTYTLMSKRKLLELVREGHVSGWDDPRMPTLAGMRRRGYTPEAIRKLCETVGVTKYNSVTEAALLDHCLREDLNRRAPRRMAVLDPLKVVITNYPAHDGDAQTEQLEAINNPEDASAGTRSIPFSGELYIERDDFMQDPPRKFKRLSPGVEARLRYGYFITCTDVVKDDAGNIVELRCTYDPATRGGNSPDGRKPKGTIHWVCASHAMDIEVRLYEPLFTTEDPNDAADSVEEAGEGASEGWRANLNPHSLRVVRAKAEPALAEASSDLPVQFERLGYFVVDEHDSTPEHPVFHRTIALKDRWPKAQQKG